MFFEVIQPGFLIHTKKWKWQ